MANARSTSDVYSLDTASGAVTRWTESELGGVVAAELSEPELVRWKSLDGLAVSGFSTTPGTRP
jgi:dipeptidyl aminopeptidase/acylaminoacyl peptidase